MLLRFLDAAAFYKNASCRGVYCRIAAFAAAVCRPGAVGGGDVKLMAAGGFFLGLSAVWDSLAFGMALAGGYCLCLMLLRNGREQKIALGPFLSMGLMFGMFHSMGA